MSILDFLINIVLFFINSTAGILPNEFSGFSLSQFENILNSISTTFITSFNFIENFLPIQLIFTLLGIIIIAEILLHFGFKATKWIINIVRGSGG